MELRPQGLARAGTRFRTDEGAGEVEDPGVPELAFADPHDGG